jgi:hypothetical protein
LGSFRSTIEYTREFNGLSAIRCADFLRNFSGHTSTPVVADVAADFKRYQV